MSGWGIKVRLIAVLLPAGLLLAACDGGRGLGTAWGDGAFRSNGERIYFSATSESGGRINYTGGPDPRGMMMGGRLACASCHGTDARGGLHTMHMEPMDAPNIRWQALVEHESDPHEDTTETGPAHDVDIGYEFDTFRLAVTEGLHPDGEPLNSDMPRWRMTEADMQDLVEYLQSFPAP